MCEFCNDDLNLRHSYVCTKLTIKPESVSADSNFEPKVKTVVQEEVEEEKINKTEKESMGKKYAQKI